MRAAALLMALLGLGFLGAYVYREARGPGYDARGIPVERYVLRSQLARRSLTELAVVPPGGGKRNLLVLLHGRGSSPASLLSTQLFRELGRLGRRAPVVVLLDGGDHSYFHDRGDGAWGSYVLVEAIPDAIRRFGTTRRVAIGGVSMGGFGALDLARVDPGRFCAVGGHSAALWSSAGATPAGAFDDAADFGRHDVLRYARTADRPYRGLRVWLDVGTADPFRAADTALATALKQRGARVAFHVWPGGHERRYWNAHMPQYLRFYASALADA
ncbi:MAG TPA: alpha/beta hydrolase-fold protein [Gaiellaceae bacterium]|nr:alpha/beta hydrolase-fold protein [Gaiellaceae bacterium]